MKTFFRTRFSNREAASCSAGRGYLWTGLLAGALLGSAQEATAQALLTNGTAYYPRLIRLAHNGAANGRLLASFDTDTVVGAVYESTDNGATWSASPVGSISENTPPGHCCSGFYEVPQQLGNTAPGTLFWAPSVGTDQTPRTTCSIRIYKSTDLGRHWSYFSTPVSGTTGLWEAEFTVDSQNRLVMYYSSEERKASGYNQMLAHKVSTDGGLTWGDETIDVGVPDNGKRPGMAVVRRVPNGTYVMTYEVCGVGNCDAYMRTSPDGVNWGTASDLGTRIQSTAGNYFAHAPALSWTADGTANGKLMAVAQTLYSSADVLADNNGKVFMVNTNNGVGAWTEVAAPVESPTGGWEPCRNYSSQLLGLDNGTRVLELALRKNDNNCQLYYNTGSLTATPGGGSTGSGGLTAGYYRLTNKNSGKVLDVNKCDPGNFGTVQQYDRLDNDCQTWKLDDLGDGYYRILNKNSGRVLDVSKCDPGNFGKVQQYDWLNNDCQRWRLTDLGDGYYRITNKNSGRVLEVNKCDPGNFGTVQQYDWLNNDCQRWQLSLVAATAARTTLAAKTAASPAQEFLALPNPATQQLTIRARLDAGTTTKLTLTDLLSRPALTETHWLPAGAHSLSLDVSRLSPGVYILRTECGNQHTTQKVVIER